MRRREAVATLVARLGLSLDIANASDFHLAVALATGLTVILATQTQQQR